MKIHIKHNIFFLALALMLAAFAGCQKNDKDTDYGITNIYMPQATISGGSNLNYVVPAGRDSMTYNYRIDTKNKVVNIPLGVLRSGKQSGGGFSVTVSSRADTVNTLIGNGLIKVAPNATKTVVLLPTTAYTLPTTVSVADGQYLASFNLSVDIATLKTYAGKKVAVCVQISNSSAYTINTAINKVIVIIDVDTLNLP